MSFHLYSRISGTCLAYVCELKLTGPTGPLGRYICAHAQDKTTFEWNLEAADILALAEPCLDPEKYAIVIELPFFTNQPPVHQLLISIRGQSNQTDSDLLIVSCPLPIAAAKARTFDLSEGICQQEIIEPLSLSGGTLGGRFFWRAPKADISASVFLARDSTKIAASQVA
jgi:hypothetical protein